MVIRFQWRRGVNTEESVENKEGKEEVDEEVVVKHPSFLYYSFPKTSSREVGAV